MSWFACSASSHGRKMVLTPAGKHVYVHHRFPGIRAIITLISHVRIYLSHAHRFRPVISSAYKKGSHLIVTDTDTDTLSHRSDTRTRSTLNCRSNLAPTINRSSHKHLTYDTSPNTCDLSSSMWSEWCWFSIKLWKAKSLLTLMLVGSWPLTRPHDPLHWWPGHWTTNIKLRSSPVHYIGDPD